jgi:hypothetical protein
MEREAVDALGYQARLRRFSNANREVISFLENIDIAIRQVDFSATADSAWKGRQARKDRVRPWAVGMVTRSNPSSSDPSGLQAALGIRDRASTSRKSFASEACFGQGDTAGGTLDEALADPRLQRGNAPADGGLVMPSSRAAAPKPRRSTTARNASASEKLALFMRISDL